MLAIAKRQYELAKAHPIRVFLIFFAGLMLLGPVLVSVLIFPLTLDAWLSSTEIIAGFSAFFAIGIALHLRTPWLSGWDCQALLLQVVVAGIIVCVPYGSWQGYFHSNFTFIPNMWWPFGGAVFALLCSWGILRDRWWGYFGEAIIISCVWLILIYFPIKDIHPTPPKTALKAWHDLFSEIAGWVSFVLLIGALFRRGWTRLKASRTALEAAR